MSKKFNIREWILFIKYWSLLFIPHISICLIFFMYSLIGASIIQELESNEQEISSSIKYFQRERERFLLKIIDKREILDLQQYTKYVYRHLRQYEEEIKKSKINFEQNSSWTFSESLFFIGTTLTTISSNEFIPKRKRGKLFVMFYTAFGIPLTLVFLTDLSLLIKYLINYFSTICFYFYSSTYFLRIRRLSLFRFIEKKLNIIIEEHDDEELYSSLTFQQGISNIFTNINDQYDLTIIQLIFTLFIYISIGAYFIPSKSYIDSLYLCFTCIFSINLNDYYRNLKTNQENNVKSLFLPSIYLLFGLAIVLLYLHAIKKRIERLLTYIGKKLLRNLMEFTQQMGFHEFYTDDQVTNPDINSQAILESVLSRHQYLTRSISLNTSEQPSTIRPIGIAEPLRRYSSGIVRTYRSSDDSTDTSLDKTVQVNTIIRSCGRCSGATSSPLSVIKHNAISSSSSPFADTSSSCDDDDIMPSPPPNLDRIRQRRATLVAQTIINQMATQPRSSSIDEFVPTLPFLRNQRQRPLDTSPTAIKCSVKISASPSPETRRKRQNSQEEFLEISKQISTLLTPSDDEN